MTTLASALASGRPLVLDAALGTRLLHLGDKPARRNIDHPEAVLAIHEADVAAGADVLTTNTFAIGPATDRAIVALYGARLARQAAGPRRFVLGSMAPVGEVGARIALAELLCEAGVDGVLLDTFTGPEALSTLVALMPRLSGWVPVLVSLWRWDHGAATARALEDLGAAAIGCNCQVGMGPMVQWARDIPDDVRVPRLVRPSACLPGAEPVPPSEFAAAVPELWSLGVRLFGGCCGAIAEHVAALRGAVDRLM
jgi:methionine synthase I (cobalamin-dependent)